MVFFVVPAWMISKSFSGVLLLCPLLGMLFYIEILLTGFGTYVIFSHFFFLAPFISPVSLLFAYLIEVLAVTELDEETKGFIWTLPVVVRCNPKELDAKVEFDLEEYKKMDK
jgi:hypothetical protein